MLSRAVDVSRAHQHRARVINQLCEKKQAELPGSLCLGRGRATTSMKILAPLLPTGHHCPTNLLLVMQSLSPAPGTYIT